MSEEPRDKRDFWCWVAIVLILACVLGGFLIQPYFEMRAFNKFTKGPKATYIDALFSNLRIMAE